MGQRRAGDVALGGAAVRRPALQLARLFALLAPALLNGCQAAPHLVGALSGGTVAALTANPAVGAAAGIAARAAYDYADDTLSRRWTATEQEAIAAAAGPLAAGGRAVWSARHTVPIGNDAGSVQVTRLISTPLTLCKEVVFWSALDDEAEERPYAAQICETNGAWVWATAEPAVARWGSLQ